MPSIWTFSPVLLAVALAGCSSTPPSSGSARDGNSGAGGSATSGGAGGNGAPKCDAGPGYAEPAQPQEVTRVTATLLDEDDEPVTDEMVQVCGTDICVQGSSATNGGVVISPRQAITKPAFKFGMGVQTPRFAWLLPDEAEVDLGVVHSFRFPPLSSGAELVNAASATSGGLTLIPAAEGRIKFDKLTFTEPEQLRLRALQIPLAAAPDVVDPSFGFELIYAATPTDTVFCPPAKLIVENSAEWPANSDVEIFLHGVDVEEEWAPYGGWGKVSDARVSDDGTTIESTAPGLPVLGVLALRRR